MPDADRCICCGNCEECKLLDETYEYMKEAEGAYND